MRPMLSGQNWRQGLYKVAVFVSITIVSGMSIAGGSGPAVKVVTGQASSPVRDMNAVWLDTVTVESFRDTTRAAPEGQQWLQLQFKIAPRQVFSVTRDKISVADGTGSWPAVGFYFGSLKQWHVFDDLVESVKRRPPMFKAGDWALPLFTLGSGQADFSVLVKGEEVRLEYGANTSIGTGFLFLVPRGRHALKLRLGDLSPISVPVGNSAPAKSTKP